ncbi:hypothetical protein LZZ85_16980 [Terrimonas sp. NA20]|uniref:Lipoprotein n=1 Tax=Terrimonas ginsenosidimutans TaxID=2908004 RepID=A0ABS9KUH5_9BACT|nr:hypothetical protein [Terrimonas ginsenosidimutans]MCG2615994.1 hypothetical protein [Terrimonas ginsenosidimutans]
MRYGLILLVAASCHSPNGGSAAGNQTAAVPAIASVAKIETDPVPPSSVPYTKIPADQLTEGVLTLKENGKGILRVYNLQNQEWVAFEPDSVIPDSLKPYSAYPDYQNLVFRVTGIEAEYYDVIVNEETGLIGKIKKNEPTLTFQRWEDHVASVFSVDFDADKNPVKQDTTGLKRAAYHNNVEFFFPVKVKGDWLQVKWDEDTKEKTGWLKWRKGNTLLVYLNYIA